MSNSKRMLPKKIFGSILIRNCNEQDIGIGRIISRAHTCIGTK